MGRVRGEVGRRPNSCFYGDDGYWVNNVNEFISIFWHFDCEVPMPLKVFQTVECCWC